MTETKQADPFVLLELAGYQTMASQLRATLTAHPELLTDYELPLSGSKPVRVSPLGIYDVVTDFGAPPYPADSAPHFQAAIDAATRSSNQECGTVSVPPGHYSWQSPIELKNAHLRGSVPNSSVRIYWDGANDEVVLTKRNNSFGDISGINFRAGTGIPAVWMDLVEGLVDKHLAIRNIHFQDWTEAAIRSSTWVNLHLADIRWDASRAAGWAIKLITTHSMNLSSFVLDRFTYDHSAVTVPASGFICVDNSANASNLGTFKLSNARLEINRPWTESQTLVHYKLPDSSTMPRSLGLHISDVTVDVSGPGAMDNAVVLYRDTVDTNGNESLMLTNFRSNGLSQLLGGSWPVKFPRPPAGHYNHLDLGWASNLSMFHRFAFADPKPTADGYQVEVFGPDRVPLGYIQIKEPI